MFQDHPHYIHSFLCQGRAAHMTRFTSRSYLISTSWVWLPAHASSLITTAQSPPTRGTHRSNAWHPSGRILPFGVARAYGSAGCARGDPRPAVCLMFRNASADRPRIAYHGRRGKRWSRSSVCRYRETLRDHNASSRRATVAGEMPLPTWAPTVLWILCRCTQSFRMTGVLDDDLILAGGAARSGACDRAPHPLAPRKGEYHACRLCGQPR